MSFRIKTLWAAGLKYSGLILLGLLVGLLLAEIGLRLLPEQMLNQMIALHPIRYALYQTDPNIGWRLRPNAEYIYQHDGVEVPVKINSLGLHDIEHTYDKPAGVYRILILGDSFTEGVQVPLADNFSRRLEDCLNQHYQQPIEVINTGVSYYSNAEELFFLQYEGRRYQPDLVLVAVYVGNDIEAYESRKKEDGWVAALGGYLTELDEAGNLKKTWLDWANPGPYEDLSPVQRFLQRYSRIYFLLANPESKPAEWLDKQKDAFFETFWGRWLAPSLPPAQAAPSSTPRVLPDNFKLLMYAPTFPDGPDMPPAALNAWAVFSRVFSELSATSTGMGARLGAIIIPAREQAHEHYYQDAYQKLSKRYGVALAHIAWNYAQPNQALGRLFEQNGLPYLDLLPPMRAYDAAGGPFLYFKEDGHLTQEGHRLTAEAACQWIQEQQLVTPPASTASQ